MCVCLCVCVCVYVVQVCGLSAFMCIFFVFVCFMLSGVLPMFLCFSYVCSCFYANFVFSYIPFFVCSCLPLFVCFCALLFVCSCVTFFVFSYLLICLFVYCMWPVRAPISARVLYFAIFPIHSMVLCDYLSILSCLCTHAFVHVYLFKKIINLIYEAPRKAFKVSPFSQDNKVLEVMS